MWAQTLPREVSNASRATVASIYVKLTPFHPLAPHPRAPAQRRHIHVQPLGASVRNLRGAAQRGKITLRGQTDTDSGNSRPVGLPAPRNETRYGRQQEASLHPSPKDRLTAHVGRPHPNSATEGDRNLS
eukprot:4389156-Pleurochrysis_carterae.AAC.1